MLGDGGHPFKLDIGLFPEEGANSSIVHAFNDARGSAAPEAIVPVVPAATAQLTGAAPNGR